jgi:hypothetical protein
MKGTAYLCEALKGQDEVTTIRRTTPRPFGAAVTSSVTSMPRRHANRMTLGRGAASYTNPAVNRERWMGYEEIKRQHSYAAVPEIGIVSPSLRQWRLP